MITRITPPRVAFLDPRTGAIAREWYQFFLSLYEFSETGEVDLGGLTQLPPVMPPSVDAYQDQSPPLVPYVVSNDAAPPVWSSNGASVPPIAVTPGASPYTFVNDIGYAADMIVSIGTVTLVEFGRAGVFANTGLVAGMFRLSPFDSIRVTYAVAPTMTLVTR